MRAASSCSSVLIAARPTTAPDSSRASHAHLPCAGVRPQQAASGTAQVEHAGAPEVSVGAQRPRRMPQPQVRAIPSGRHVWLASSACSGGSLLESWAGF